MDHDDEIRELRSPESLIIRTVSAENFLALNIFRMLDPEAISVAEFLQLFDFALDDVRWKAAPPYSVLLRFVGESGRSYFITTDRETMRLYCQDIDAKQLLSDQKANDWQRVAADLLKAEFGQ